MSRFGKSEKSLHLVIKERLTCQSIHVSWKLAINSHVDSHAKLNFTGMYRKLPGACTK